MKAVGVALLIVGMTLVVLLARGAWFFINDGMADWLEMMDFRNVSKWDAFWASGGWGSVVLLLAVSIPGLVLFVFGIALFMEGRYRDELGRDGPYEVGD